MSKLLFREGFLLAHRNFPQGGTCLEFGVGSGRTYLWQANQLVNKYRKSTLVGFDSWAGLPAEAEGVWYPDRHEKGRFSFPKTCVGHVLAIIDDYDENKHRFRFVDGFFSESLTDEARKAIGNVIFINIDVDMYVSTLQLLDFVKPFLQRGTILHWDDWLDPADVPHANGNGWGEHRAWKEWSDKHPDIKARTVKTNIDNQRIMEIL